MLKELKERANVEGIILGEYQLRKVDNFNRELRKFLGRKVEPGMYIQELLGEVAKGKLSYKVKNRRGKEKEIFFTYMEVLTGEKVIVFN